MPPQHIHGDPAAAEIDPAQEGDVVVHGTEATTARAAMRRKNANARSRHWKLDAAADSGAFGAMATPTEENFHDYKRAERKALEILAEMKAATPKKVDIELALLVAVFELHKGTVPADKIASVVQGHLKQLVPYYAAKSPTAG